MTGIGKRIGLVVELEFASLHLYVLYPVLVSLAVPGKHQVAGRQVGLELHLAFAGGGALDRNDRGGRCQFRLHVSLLAQRHGIPVIVNGNHHLRGARQRGIGRIAGQKALTAGRGRLGHRNPGGLRGHAERTGGNYRDGQLAGLRLQGIHLLGETQTAALVDGALVNVLGAGEGQKGGRSQHNHIT